MRINQLQKAYTIIVLSFIIIALSPSPSIFAEDNPPSNISVDAKVDKTNITVGDVVTFSLTVKADKDIQFPIPDFNGQFKGFDLIDNGVEKTQKKNGQRESVYWYQLRANLPGIYTISPISLNFMVPDPQNKDKTIQGQILTPEVIVEIKSILHLQGQPMDIRDIKSILDISGNWLRYLLIFLLVLAISGPIVWLWKLDGQAVL